MYYIFQILDIIEISTKLVLRHFCQFAILQGQGKPPFFIYQNNKSSRVPKLNLIYKLVFATFVCGL